MSEVKGQRDVVQDPLRARAQQGTPERAVPTQGVRGPNLPSGNLPDDGIGQAIGGLQQAMDQHLAANIDEWVTEGKTAYMAGVTEDELLQQGNRYTMMGYQQLKVRNDVNNWFLQEGAGIDQAYKSMSSEDYQAHMKEQRKAFMKDIKDPYARKVASAAFEQHSPALARSQFLANNEYAMEQRENEFGEYLRTGSLAAPTRSQLDPNSPLKLSPQPVTSVMQLPAMDRDAVIKTVIGEAGNQGDVGMAAVAHVIRNRVSDSRFQNDFNSVVFAPKQFSVWNKGKEGNPNLHNLNPNSARYKKAAAVVDAVMSGRHVDPTGGALYYYSPSGMKAYKQQGIQNHLVPKWAAKHEAENLVVLGAHRFSGKSDGATGAPRMFTNERAGMPMIDEEPSAIDNKMNADNTSGTPSGNAVDLLNADVSGEGVAGIKPAGAPNEVLDFIQNYQGIPNDRKASILSQTMVDQLTAGEDTLWNDAGGTATLQQMGASPKEISAVNKARAKWQNEQDKKFDADELAFEDDVMRMAADDGTTREEVFELIEARKNAGLLSDEKARSLARTAAAKVRATAESNAKTATKDQEARDSAFNDPDFLQEVGSVYQSIQLGDMDFDEASANIKIISDRYGLDGNEVKSLMGRIFSLDQQQQNALRTKAEQQIKKAEASNVAKAEAEQALARGYGLDEAKGKVLLKREDGSTIKMSAKEYGITKVKNDAFARFEGDTAAIANHVFSTLQRHGIVDPQTQAQLQAAVAGQIIGKDGKVNQSAQEAYDLYTLLRENPNIRDDYVGQLVGEDYTRNVLELAYKLDSGNQTGAEALVRAQEIVQNGGDVNARLPNTPLVNSAAQQVTDDLIEETLAVSWYEKLYTNADVLGRRERAATDYRDSITAQLRSAADTYMVQYPWQKPEVALELAKQDVKKKMKMVNGSLVFTTDKLHVKMGVSDPANVDKAVAQYLFQYGKDLWPDIDDSFFGGDAEDSGFDPYFPDKVRIDYMPNVGNGAFRLSRVIDPETGAIDTGRPMIISLDAFGKNFNTNEATPTIFENMFDAGSDAVGAGRRAIQNSNADVENARDLGQSLGDEFLTTDTF